MEPCHHLAQRGVSLAPVGRDELEWSTSYMQLHIVAELRAEIRRSLRSWGVDGDPLRGVVLVASELVTNVARYAPGRCQLSLFCGPTTIRITVADGEWRIPPIPHELPNLDAESGRGLYMVWSTCAGAVRWERLPQGKRIIADIAADLAA